MTNEMNNDEKPTRLRRRKDQWAHPGLERLRWEASHTYKDMAGELSVSMAHLLKISRGERATDPDGKLSSKWVTRIRDAYSRVLGRPVTALEVMGEQSNPFFDLDQLAAGQTLTEAGVFEEPARQWTARIEARDIASISPAGAYAYLSADTMVLDGKHYIVKFPDSVRCVLFKSDNQARFETRGLERETFFMTEPHQVLYRVTAFLIMG